MAIGWMGLLKSVPWKDVVSNAPKIADGAKSLWSAVAKKVRPVDTSAPYPEAEANDMPLASRVAALESSHGDLQRQLVTSSELIRSLADQNALLIARLDAQQVRLRWLSGLILVSLLASGAALALAMKLIP